MASFDDIRALGYSVEESFRLESDIIVFRVDGHGVATMVRGDDTAVLEVLADPAAHTERVTQAKEVQATTLRRWVRQRRILPSNVQDVT